VEDDTYIPSSRAHSQGKGKEVADASGSGARNEDAKAESHDEGSSNDDDDEVEETFDVEEIAPSSYMHMGTPIFRQPQNLDWREKISYKGKIELVREKRKENPRLVDKDVGIDYRFHTAFQRDFYKSVIIPKNKLVEISQWIDWTYMENKHDSIFDEMVAVCEAKHLREIMAFTKNWNNEIIVQFFATLYVEERGDTWKFH
jgi:hypothetical protein